MKPLNYCLVLALLPVLSLAQGTHAPAPATPTNDADEATAILQPADTNATTIVAPKRSAAGTNRLVYVIPVQQEITRTSRLIIEKGVAAAEDAGADAIVLDMDTPGGRLDHTEKIMTALLKTELATYTFVNNFAISAGAMIAFSTDHIYMNSAGLIGDAMPIMVIPGQGPQPMPEDLKEKMVSPTEAMIRRAAQQKGHDTELAACMVRRELSYRIGEKEICKEGQLLTLTAVDASQPVGEDDAQRSLLSAGTVDDLDGMLAEAGLTEPKIVRFDVPASVAFSKVLQGSTVSVVILGLGILLIYIEFKIPGFGVPGVAGICLIALWFWAHAVVGLAGMTEILILGVGVGLLLLEIFVIPGFGVTGVTGLILIVAALLMAMVDVIPEPPSHAPDLPRIAPYGWDYVQASLSHAIAVLGSTLIVSFVGMIGLARYLPKTHAFQKLMLMKSLDDDEGFQAATQHSELVGQTGTTETPLRPAGIGVIGDKRMNVVAKGEFVAKGQAIVVKEVHGNRVVVAPAETEQAEPASEDNTSTEE